MEALDLTKAHREFARDDVDAVMSRLKEIDTAHFQRSLIDEASRLGDRFLKWLNSSATSQNAVFILTDQANVAFRIDSLRCLLESLRHEMPKKAFEDALGMAGRRTGAGFFWTMISYLVSAEVIPRDHAHAIDFWSYYDGAAGWGDFQLEHGDDSLRIRLENSFLYRAFGDHGACEFFRGYIQSILDCLVFFVPRWREEVNRQAGSEQQVMQVNHVAGTNACLFECSLGAAKLPYGSRALFSAYRHAFEHDFSAAQAAARNVISAAPLELLNQDPNSRVRVEKLLGAVTDQALAPVTAAPMKGYYKRLSDPLHGRSEMDAIETRRIIDEVAMFVFDLGRAQVSRRKRDKICEVIVVSRQSSKKE